MEEKSQFHWLHDAFYRPESIARPQSAALPSPLKAARAIANDSWRREVVFLHQARLLANYEDSCQEVCGLTRYYPTYEDLLDYELRSYFGWRTRLRKGSLEKSCLTFAFLYIYELLNLVGVADAREGYWRLRWFLESYSQLDERLTVYSQLWLPQYVVFYGLEPELLADTPEVQRDNAIDCLCREDTPDPALLAAVETLLPGALSKSRLFKKDEPKALLCRVLRSTALRCRDGKTTLADRYFGRLLTEPVRFFATAVFCHPHAPADMRYTIDPQRIYERKNGTWYLSHRPDQGESKFRELIKSVDSLLRPHFGLPPIQRPLTFKWLEKLVEETFAQYTREQAASRLPSIDLSRLDRIRADAAQTRERLLVDEERPEPEPAPAPPKETLGLSGPETRLLQCLLYEKPLDWVRKEGHMLSVLADGINEKLFDLFSDTVLLPGDSPELLEDYREALKERIQP